jgi:hypothetical protein
LRWLDGGMPTMIAPAAGSGTAARCLAGGCRALSAAPAGGGRALAGGGRGLPGGGRGLGLPGGGLLPVVVVLTGGGLRAAVDPAGGGRDPVACWLAGGGLKERLTGRGARLADLLEP